MSVAPPSMRGGSALRAAPWWQLVVGAVTWQVIGTSALVLLGATLRDAGALTFGVGIQFVGGVILWSLVVREPRPGPERLGMGLVLGGVMAVLAGVVGNAFLAWSWWWTLPSIVLLLVFVMRRLALVPRREPRVDPAWFPVAAGVIVGLGLLFLNLRRYPLAWQGNWDGYHPDMVFFEALGNSVARFGSNDSIFMAGGDLRYHWLTYAWSAQLSSAWGAEPFMVLTRVLPLVALVALVALVVAMVQRLGAFVPNGLPNSSSWLAVALVVTGGYVGAVNGTILNFDSPSQALTAAWFMGFVIVVMQLLNRAPGEPGGQGISGQGIIGVLLGGILGFALTAGKVSAGFVAVTALGIAAVVGLVTRAPWARRGVLLTAVLGVASMAAFLLFVWGSASPGDLRFLDWNGRASTIQGLNSSPAVRGVALGTLTLLLAMSARWVGGIWLVGDRRWRARFEPWFGIGLAIAGALPVLLFAQGLNETWFALTASAPLAALAAVGVVVAWHRAELGLPDAVAAVVVGIAGVVLVAYIWTDQVWESGIGRFWGPWLGLAFAVSWAVLFTLIRRRFALVPVLAVATLVFTVEAVGARATPIIGAVLGGARDGSGVRAVSLAEPSVTLAPTPPVVTGESSTEPSNLVPSERAAHVWSQRHAEAGAFLRANAGQDDIIVTNETNAYLVPALTRLRTVISGVPYQATYGSNRTAERIPERIALNDAAIAEAQPLAIEAMCESGARWVWISNDRAPLGDASGIAQLVFANDAVQVFEFDDTRCETLQ